MIVVERRTPHDCSGPLFPQAFKYVYQAHKNAVTKQERQHLGLKLCAWGNVTEVAAWKAINRCAVGKTLLRQHGVLSLEAWLGCGVGFHTSGWERVAHVLYSSHPNVSEHRAGEGSNHPQPGPLAPAILALSTYSCSRPNYSLSFSLQFSGVEGWQVREEVHFPTFVYCHFWEIQTLLSLFWDSIICLVL